MKEKISRVVLDDIRNCTERKRICQMYFTAKKREFTQQKTDSKSNINSREFTSDDHSKELDHDKSKENCMPFNYEAKK